MAKEEAIKHWLESAERNLDVAKGMYKLKHYNWCLFMWHLAIEKTIKAYIVSLDKEVPYQHDLMKLMRYANMNLDNIEDMEKGDVNEITSFNLEARYEEYKQEFYKKATKEFTDERNAKCERLYTWTKKHIQ